MGVELMERASPKLKVTLAHKWVLQYYESSQQLLA